MTEHDYKPDFDISDRYISFSAEILRLSLLGIAGIGTIILTRIKGEDHCNCLNNLWPFLTAIVFFVFSSAAALFHRYYATDCMSYYIAFLRFKEKIVTDVSYVERAEEQKNGFHKKLDQSRYALITAEIIFAVGVFVFAVAIFKLLL